MARIAEITDSRESTETGILQDSSTFLSRTLHAIGHHARPMKQLEVILDAAFQASGADSGGIGILRREGGIRFLVSKNFTAVIRSSLLENGEVERTADPRTTLEKDISRTPIRLGEEVVGYIVLRQHDGMPMLKNHAGPQLQDLALLASLSIDRYRIARAAGRKLHRLRRTLATLHDDVFLVDQDLSIFGVDGERPWNGSLVDASSGGARLQDFLPAPTVQGFLDNVKRVLKRASTMAFEIEVPLEDSSRRFVVQLHPLSAKVNGTAMVLVSAQDRTQCQGNEQRLRNRLTHLRRALDRLPVGLLVLEESTEGRHTVSVANRTLDRILCSHLGIWLGEEGEKALDIIQKCFTDGSELEGIRGRGIESDKGCLSGADRLVDGTLISWQVHPIPARKGRKAAEVWSFFSAPRVVPESRLPPVAVAELADQVTAIVGYSEILRRNLKTDTLDELPGSALENLATAATAACRVMRQQELNRPGAPRTES